MKSLRPLVILFVTFALLATAGVAAAQSTFTVPIHSEGGSSVSGSAVLTATDGGTSVSLDISGLGAGTTAQTSLHAGTCSAPGASAAALPTLTADTAGRATGSGMVLFRGTENVALPTVADGEHVILVSQGNQVVACGTIPLAENIGTPGMPRTGSGLLLLVAAGLAILALVAVRAGLALRSAR
jgi:hypothetical protein